MDTFTIRRRGKVIGQVGIDGPYPLSAETIDAAWAEARHQAKEHNVAIKSRPQRYRRKRKAKNA